MKFLVLGATGMAGHMIAIYLKEQHHDVTTFSRKKFPFAKNIIGDVRDLHLLESIINKEEFDAIINCIGVLNQNAEINKDQAVFLNSYLPHYIRKITSDRKTRVIHMSTDCVFSGGNGPYDEDSFKDGASFYDRSKALGEINNDKDLTFRNSIIGPDMKKEGIGLFNWFMKQSTSIEGYDKAIWTGVSTLTLAKAIEKAAQVGLTGLYHLVNNRFISKYELLKLFNQYFKNDELVIKKNEQVVINKSLINHRKDFDFRVPSYEMMVKEMKIWIKEHEFLYTHYRLN